MKKNVSPDRRKKALKDAEVLCEEFGFRQTLMEMIKADGRI